jgi:hypothetical protein
MSPARIVVAAVLIVGCGKKGSDGEKQKPGSEAAEPTESGGGATGPQGCSGPGHRLVQLGGDFAKTWCVTIYFGGFDDCIRFPVSDTGFDVNIDDPDAKASEGSSFRLQLRELLAVGTTYTLSKGEDGTVIRSADGVETNADGISFGWNLYRDGTWVMTGYGHDGWTTGTIRVTKVPQKKCDDYELAFDLELHHPELKAPAKLTAPGVAFR